MDGESRLGLTTMAKLDRGGEEGGKEEEKKTHTVGRPVFGCCHYHEQRNSSCIFSPSLPSSFPTRIRGATA
jgi:hypothetical protein